MANYSGTVEEQKAKAKAYRIAYQNRDEYVINLKTHRATPEYKELAKKASKKFRSTEAYRKKMRALKQTQKYKDVRRNQLLMKTFNITLDDYRVMLAAQGGTCAICHTIETIRMLAVDHDHVTGAIRGLLCRRCNISIGLMQDDVELLDSAIAYLQKSEA